MGDYKCQAISGLWSRMRVHESRTVTLTNKPLFDHWGIHESWKVEGAKTPHHQWQQPLQPSPKLLLMRLNRAHWLGIKLNTPANKAKPPGSKPNKRSTLEPQHSNKHKR